MLIENYLDKQGEEFLKFSVLMSVYFCENSEYFDMALKSITIDQILMPDEIVIVEDGPLTPELQAVIDKYIELFPRLFNIVHLPENKGLGNALRIGLLKCKYDIVARMDSDDISMPDRFEKQIKFLQSNSDIALVGSFSADFKNDPNNITGIRELPETPEEVLRMARRRSPISHPSVVFRKHAVLDAGNYQSFIMYEDWYLWARMLMKGYRFANIPEPLVLFRVDEGLYKRRGGLVYVYRGIKFQKCMLNLGFTNIFDFIYTVTTRSTIGLMPNSLRKLVYEKMFRKKKP